MIQLLLIGCICILAILLGIVLDALAALRADLRRQALAAERLYTARLGDGGRLVVPIAIHGGAQDGTLGWAALPDHRVRVADSIYRDTQRRAHSGAWIYAPDQPTTTTKTSNQ